MLSILNCVWGVENKIYEILCTFLRDSSFKRLEISSDLRILSFYQSQQNKIAVGIVVIISHQGRNILKKTTNALKTNINGNIRKRKRRIHQKFFQKYEPKAFIISRIKECIQLYLSRTSRNRQMSHKVFFF